MFKYIEENISIYHIKEDTFIKVMILDASTGIMNVEVFYKVNSRYRRVDQRELPNDIVNILATTEGEEISKEEEIHFKKFLETSSIGLSNTNIENVKTIFGTTLFTNYMITKTKGDNYYVLQNVITNEFGIMSANTPILTPLIPYVFADIIKKGNKFKKEIFLVQSDIFVQLNEIGNLVLGIIYQLEENEQIDKAMFSIIGLFIIEKDCMGDFIIKTKSEDLNKIPKLQKNIDNCMQQFIKKLGLQD